MRIALLSDIHSNSEALKKVLTEVDEQAVDEIWCLGDIAGINSRRHPHESIEMIREHGDLVIRGNQDVMVMDEINWGRQYVLSAEDRTYLQGLNFIEKRHGITAVHGSIRDHFLEFIDSMDVATECLKKQETRICVFGHTHVPAIFAQKPNRVVEQISPYGQKEINITEGKWLINPGSVGCPQADFIPVSSWALLDTDQQTLAYFTTELVNS